MLPLKLSIVMPSHNRAATLARAIDSVLAQTDVARELIVVDDGSTDGTAELLQSYGDRLIVVRLERNGGSNHARNRGIERAKGDVVCFIDSDDEFLPHKLRFVAEYFTDNPKVDALIDSFETRFPPQHHKASLWRINPTMRNSADMRRAIFDRTIYKATPAISVRRQALFDIGLFDETLKRRQDMDLILRLSQNHVVDSTDQVLWLKHWSADAISSKQHTFLAATIDICERHPDYLTESRYRRGLDRDLGRHFWRLLKAGRFGALRVDLARYRAFGRFGASPWLLMLKYLQRRRQRPVSAQRRGVKLPTQQNRVIAPTQH